jgi:hypothetical protein
MTASANQAIASTSGPHVQEVCVSYDETNDGVTVTPDIVDKGTTVRFTDRNGGKLRIVFLSPTGKESDSVLDSQLCTMVIGGIYHFKCFFTPVGATHEVSPQNGGEIVVSPNRP